MTNSSCNFIRNRYTSPNHAEHSLFDLVERCIHHSQQTTTSHCVTHHCCSSPWSNLTQNSWTKLQKSIAIFPSSCIWSCSSFKGKQDPVWYTQSAATQIKDIFQQRHIFKEWENTSLFLSAPLTVWSCLKQGAACYSVLGFSYRLCNKDGFEWGGWVVLLA